MQRTYHRWYARALGRDMELLVFGHAGPPFVVFPSSMGSFYEYEDRGMVAAVSGKIDYGQLQLFCVASVDAESWYNRRVHPRDRLTRHLQYEQYLLGDVLPLIRHLAPHQPIGVTGCSFGAFHSMTLALRHPHIFSSCVTMGGAFDVKTFLDGYADDDAYFLNPTQFVPNLWNGHDLDRIRHNKWVLATGEHDICRGANESFGALLASKQIPHSLHVWQHGSKHDWPDWRPMAAAYLP